VAFRFHTIYFVMAYPSFPALINDRAALTQVVMGNPHAQHDHRPAR